MKKLVLLTLALCLCTPVLFATDSGKAAGSSVVTTASTYNNTTRAPGSLTTLFAANNWFAGNLFDINPLTTLTEATAFDINWISPGEAVEVDFYYKLGTCEGFGTNPGAWTPFASGSNGSSAGMDLPTFIDIAGNGLTFNSGETYGITVHVSNYAALIGALGYRNGQDTFANAELSLTTWYGGADPPFTTAFFPRMWNGTIYYEAGPPAPLSVSPGEISAWFGGTATFKLNGGPDLAGRGYGLFGTTSGTSPGFPLPGGGVLPINWDWFTYIVYFLSLAPGNGIVDGMLGELDQDGMAVATLTLPGHCQLFDDILTNWAWTTSYPFDFQSNPVDLLITGAPLPPPDYVYDDGSSENALGWTAGGESVWAHYFDAGIGDTITKIQSTFGQAGSTSGPPNGDPCWLYVWDDPTNDNNPLDAVLIGTGTGVIANSATNDFNDYVLDAPTAVDGGFFIGCHVWQDVGIFAAPMDQNTPYGGEAWFLGGSVFDPNDLTTTYIYEMGSIGFPAYWLLRAATD